MKNLFLKSVILTSLTIASISCENNDDSDTTQADTTQTSTETSTETPNDTDTSKDETPANVGEETSKPDPVPTPAPVNKIPGDFTVSIQEIAEIVDTEEAPSVRPELLGILKAKAPIRSTNKAYKITWTASIDPDGDAITYKVEWIDLEEILVETTTTKEFTISSKTIDESNKTGTQTIKVTAKDGKGGEKSSTATFEIPAKILLAKF